jgi:hypothetical protein
MNWNNYYQEYKMGDQTVQYKGYWDKNRQEIIGLGELKFKDGSLYQGEIKNRTFNGKGRMTRSNGDVYQGEYIDGKADGKGTFVDMEGSMYVGDWSVDKQHGHGNETWSDNGTMKYDGQYQQGSKTGKGKFEYEGSVYDGDFIDGKFHGQGKYFFADSGKIYRGKFVHNQIQGKGIMIFPDRTIYNGDFKEGRIEGHGIMQNPSGDRYIGKFKNDQKDGSGVQFNAAGQTKRQGTWVEGKRTSWIGPETPASISQFSELDENGEFIEQTQVDKQFLGQKTGKNRMSSVGTKLMAARQFRKTNLPAPAINSQSLTNDLNF